MPRFCAYSSHDFAHVLHYVSTLVQGMLVAMRYSATTRVTMGLALSDDTLSGWGMEPSIEAPQRNDVRPDTVVYVPSASVPLVALSIGTI